ncbi:MAG TPA: hypothetical protein VFZ18_03160 [Longimicrobiaceae bacterium]
MSDLDTQRQFVRAPIHTRSACTRDPNRSADVSGAFHLGAGTPT